MFKKIMMATLAVGALALGAPAAQADDPTFNCDFNAVQQEDATGQAFEGAAYGYVVHAGDTGATIRCYISVNGTEAASTTPGPVTAGRLTYSAGETDVVTFHAEVCTNHGCTTHNYETVRQQIPPQEVIDALITVIDLLNDNVFSQIDPTICPPIGSLAGTYGPITIGADGDISVEPLGLIWDCPPYVEA